MPRLEFRNFLVSDKLLEGMLLLHESSTWSFVNEITLLDDYPKKQNEQPP